MGFMYPNNELMAGASAPVFILRPSLKIF